MDRKNSSCNQYVKNDYTISIPTRVSLRRAASLTSSTEIVLRPACLAKLSKSNPNVRACAKTASDNDATNASEAVTCNPISSSSTI